MTAGGYTTMSGYSILETASIKSALAMAKACSFFDIDGSLGVSELMQMPC